MENNRLWAGLFLLFMYDQPAPSGGKWSPENNALTDWCRMFSENSCWAPHDAMQWLENTKSNIFVMAPFVWETRTLIWGILDEKWNKRIMQCERIKHGNSKKISEYENIARNS